MVKRCYLIISFTDIYPSETFASIVACLAGLEGLGSNLENILGKTNSEEGSERWPLTGVCPIQMAGTGGGRAAFANRGLCFGGRLPSFLSLVFSSAAPLFLKPAPSASVRRPVYPGKTGSRVPDFRRRTKLSGKASKHGIPRQVPIQNCLSLN